MHIYARMCPNVLYFSKVPSFNSVDMCHNFPHFPYVPNFALIFLELSSVTQVEQVTLLRARFFKSDESFARRIISPDESLARRKFRSTL